MPEYGKGRGHRGNLGFPIQFVNPQYEYKEEKEEKEYKSPLEKNINKKKKKDPAKLKVLANLADKHYVSI